MEIREFSKQNLQRCEALSGFNHALNSWSLSDWMVALTGEIGEAANVIKKLNRVRDGDPGNTETAIELDNKLGDELADAYIYLDLLIQAAGFDVEDIVLDKFQRTSGKIGYQNTE